jgi:hypothetical protein
VLEKLEVEHVALMSHSAGTFYAFNTAVMLPHLLYPGRGFMACLGMFLSFSLPSFSNPCLPPIYLAPVSLFLSLVLYMSRSCITDEETAPWTHPSLSSAPLMQVVDKLPSSWIGNLHHILSFVNGYITPPLAFSSAKMGGKGSLTEEECVRYYGMNADTWDEVERLQGKWQGREDMRFVLFLSP